MISKSTSSLANIELPSPALQDNRIFSIAAAKTTLEMEAAHEQINIGDVEVFSYKNSSGKKDDSIKWIEQFKESIHKSGYAVYSSEKDPLFTWIANSQKYFLVYTSAGKKVAALYIGVADRIPYMRNSVSTVQSNDIELETTTQEIRPASTTKTTTPSGNNSPELIGNWGMLAGAKVNWQDSSTGVMVVSGVSKGFGIEFKDDGTFLHVTVVTSGRPSYRVFVSTTGTWSSTDNEIHFYPTDRHYRKWENEIIMVNEHSVPEKYMMFWRKGTNIYTHKSCLYVRYSDESEEREICSE